MTDTNQARFSGAYTALMTPFRNGKIDEGKLIDLIQWQIEQGIHGLVPVGTTGESPTLSKEEHQRVIDITVTTTAGRVPVIAGAGSNNPVEAIGYVQFAQTAGADAVLSVTGYYNRPDQNGLYAHFKAIHNATDIPIIIYNIPPRTIVDILPETMQKLSQLERVVGVKDATMDLSRISQERQLIQKPFSYLSGDDVTALAYNAMGGYGCISVIANVLPNLTRQLQEACRAENYRKALQLHEKMMPLMQALSMAPNPVGIKYAAQVLGLSTADVRLPYTEISIDAKNAIETALKNLA